MKTICTLHFSDTVLSKLEQKEKGPKSGQTLHAQRLTGNVTRMKRFGKIDSEQRQS